MATTRGSENMAIAWTSDNMATAQASTNKASNNKASNNKATTRAHNNMDIT